MNQFLNTRAARGLPGSVRNRKKKPKSRRCRLGIHDFSLFDLGSPEGVPTTYPPDKPVGYVSPKRICHRCLKIQWLVGPEVCGGKKPRWVDPLGETSYEGMARHAAKATEHQELTQALRQAFGVSEKELTDEEVLKLGRETMTGAGIRMTLAFLQLKRALAEACPALFGWFNTCGAGFSQIRRVKEPVVVEDPRQSPCGPGGNHLDAREPVLRQMGPNLDGEDDDHPLWLVDAQIRGLLEGEGATEDHENVLAFLRKTCLPEETVRRIHRALCCSEKGGPAS